MSLSDEIDAYGAYLNGVVAHPDDQQLWEDLQRAKDALEVAYLEAQPLAPEPAPEA